MLIDHVCPQIVGARASLTEQLAADARGAACPEGQVAALLRTLPPRLAKAQCFLDKITGLWRYEFGEPYHLEKEEQLLWGIHMWPPIRDLRRGLSCCLHRVPIAKQPPYLVRLDDPQKHMDVLSEMIPVLNINRAIPVDFEVVGRGAGNRTLDWLVGPVAGRDVLFDVKSRSVDLIQQMDQPDAGGEIPAPRHDPTLIFRGLEHKFDPADRAHQLQGAWITTHIQQELSELAAAFAALDPKKIHFAIFGHWETGGHILARDEVDRPFLANLFGVVENDRFTFNR